MKTQPAILNRRRSAGILLVECVTYIAVFAILTGVATAAFYLCWDDSKAVVYATDDIAAALRAGERWRQDIRGATGDITTTTETDGTGETLRIPTGQQGVLYRFEKGGVYREDPQHHQAQLVLPTVNSSRMLRENRQGVTAWRWELDLTVRRQETHLPLLFTFEAAQRTP
jgi:Tfp pilus assembly protein FimT